MDNSRAASADDHGIAGHGDWSPTTEIGCGAQVKIGADGTAIALWEDGPTSTLKGHSNVADANKR